MKFQDQMLEQGVKPIDGYVDYETFVCGQKLQFSIMKQAAAKAKRVANCEAYECPTCGHYHLRSRKWG